MDEEIKKILKNKCTGIKYLIKGGWSTGKTSLLQERQISLSGKMKVPSSAILVFNADHARMNRWDKELADRAPCACPNYTFASFIKEELILYYPLVLESCGEIIRKELKPEFLSYEASILLISKVIQARREKDGYFKGLVSSNEQIAAVVSSNLKAAALEGIPACEIGDRLYEALDRKDTEKENIFRNLDDISISYRRKCFGLGILDYSMAVDLYRQHLLPDQRYRQSLVKRFRHLIMDDMQEASGSMLELAELLLDTCDSAFIAYNPQAGSSIHGHNAAALLERKVFKACKEVELEKDSGESLADAIHSAVFYNKDVYIEQCQQWPTSADDGFSAENTAGGGIQSPGMQGRAVDEVNGRLRHTCLTEFERHPAVELRSEMLEQLAYKVCGLIRDEGFRPSDIIILSTYADIVTELAISNILKANGIKLMNTGSWQNAADIPICSGILAFARICHPGLRLFPEKQAARHMVQLLFGLDPIRSAKIARKVCSVFPFPELPDLDTMIINDPPMGNIKEKYDFVKGWINSYKLKDKPLNIGAFLQLAIMEVFLDAAMDPDEIFKAKQLADTAQRFSNSTAGFGRNSARDFIEMAESILKTEGISAKEDEAGDEFVMLTTPDHYRVSPVDNKVLIISGLSSRHWVKGTARELSNQRVLSASWQRGMKYTREMEETDSRQYLAAMLEAIVTKGSTRVIAFESLLSENGFENDGILPDIINRIHFNT